MFLHKPNEGDLVYFPKGNKLFEITFVDQDDPFYQVHNLPTYKLKCKTFEYASEVIDTGIAEIDAIDADNSLDMMQHQMTLETCHWYWFSHSREFSRRCSGVLYNTRNL